MACAAVCLCVYVFVCYQLRLSGTVRRVWRIKKWSSCSGALISHGPTSSCGESWQDSFLHHMQICEGTEQHISINNPQGMGMGRLRNREKQKNGWQIITIFHQSLCIVCIFEALKRCVWVNSGPVSIEQWYMVSMSLWLTNTGYRLTCIGSIRVVFSPTSDK